MPDMFSTGIYLPKNIHQLGVDQAKAAHRSFGQQVAWLIEQEDARRQHPRTLIDEGVGYAVGETATAMSNLHHFPVSQLLGETEKEEA